MPVYLAKIKFLTLNAVISFILILGTQQVKAESPTDNSVVLPTEAPLIYIDPEKEREIVNPPLRRFNFNIEPGIEFVISPNLLNFMAYNLDSFFEKLGYSPSSFYQYEYNKNSGDQSLDQMISNQRTLKSVKNIRYYFRKFFNGIRIKNTHNFDLKIEGVDVSANWKNFGIDVTQDVEKSSKVFATIKVEADRFALNVSSLKISDQRHQFMGKIGGDKIYFNLDQSKSPNLKVEIPIEIETFNGNVEQLFGESRLSNGDIRFRVLEAKTNLDQLVINTGWSAPLTMPKVSVSINGRTAYLRTDRVESAIKKQVPELVKGLQESLQQYVSDNVPVLIEDLLNNRFQKGFAEQVKFYPFYESDEELNRIELSGEFEDPEYPNAYVLGYRFKNFSMADGHLKLAIDTFMEDGLKDKNEYFNPSGHKFPYNKKIVTESGLDQSAAVVVNTDIINRYIKLSCERGLFKKIDFGDGLIVNVSNCPQTYIHKTEKEIRLKVEVEDKVGGFFKSQLVRNPIRVSFEAGLRIILNKEGLFELQLTKLHENTLKIDDQYIRFKMFKKAIINAAKTMLTDLNKKYKNFSLYTVTDLPNTFYGVQLKNLGVRLDKNGYVVFYVKAIL